MREILYEHHDAIAERARSEILASIQNGALTTPRTEEDETDA
jgi:hypothetical protein